MLLRHGEIFLAQRLGVDLPEGVAYNADGNPTTDAAEALSGVVAAWGGHKGSGLAIVVQLLGAMAAAPMMPKGMVDYGCLFVMMRPDLLMDADTYSEQVAEYARAIRQTRPVQGGDPVRMPYDRSMQVRRENLLVDRIEVADSIHERLLAVSTTNRRPQS